MYPNSDSPTGPEYGAKGLGPVPGTSKVLVIGFEFATRTSADAGEDKEVLPDDSEIGNDSDSTKISGVESISGCTTSTTSEGVNPKEGNKIVTPIVTVVKIAMNIVINYKIK